MTQNNDLKNNVQDILDNLKSEGAQLLKDFENKLEKYQKELADELSKSSSTKSDNNPPQ